MNLRLGAILVFAGLALVLPVKAGEITSGPSDQISGPFDVRAITGEHRKGDEKEQLCYVCKYGGQARPAVVLIFTRKADENLATLVKSVDAVQKKNKDLGTVVVGVGGVTDADFEKLQETHKLTTPADDRRRQGRSRRPTSSTRMRPSPFSSTRSAARSPRTSPSRTASRPPTRPPRSPRPPRMC